MQDVHAVGPEAPQAFFHRGDDGGADVAALPAADAHLGAHRDLGIERPQRAAEIGFGHAVPVCGGGVEIGDALVDRAADVAVLLGCSPFTISPPIAPHP